MRTLAWTEANFCIRADVNDIERGRRNPTVTVVEKLARPFGLNAGDLLA